MISVLSLVVAILAVFFGPLVARASVQRQIRVTSREAWMREFREKVAEFLSSYAAHRGYVISFPAPRLCRRKTAALPSSTMRCGAPLMLSVSFLQRRARETRRSFRSCGRF
jgi:hypothetical protein